MDLLSGSPSTWPMQLRCRRLVLRFCPLVTLAGVFAASCGPPTGPSVSIMLSSPSLSFTATQGGVRPAAQTINITSGDGGTLTGLALGTISYGTGQPTGWLVASLVDSAGPATLTLSDTTTSLAPGTYTALVPVTSTTASNSPQLVSVTLVMGPPACARCQLTFTVQPSNTVAGAVMTPAVQVTAKDGSGNTATGFTGLVTLAISNVADTLFGTTSVAAVHGVATLANLRIDKAGADTLTASASGFNAGGSTPFSITAGPLSATQSAVFAAPDSILTSPGASTITVIARDAFGNPIGGAVVALSATGAGNTLTEPAGPTDASGVATGGLSSTVAETKSVSATINGMPITHTVTVTIRAVSATRSTVSAAPTSFAAICGSSSVTVTALDAGGAPLSGAPVTLAVTGTGNTLTQPGQTNTTGVATGTLSSTIAETKTVSAAINGTPITQPATVTITPGPATQLCFTVQPRTTAVGRVITPAVQVTATDASGHVATGFTGPVTVAIGSNPTGAVLSGTTSVAAVNGMATFANLRINSAGTGFTLKAAASGFASAVSAPFNIYFSCGRGC